MAVSAGDTDDTIKFPFLGLEPDLLICLHHEGMFEILKVKFVIYASLVATGGDCILLCVCCVFVCYV